MTAAIEPTAKGTGWQRFGESSFVFKQGPITLRLKEVRTEDGHVLANAHAYADDGGGGEYKFMARARVNLTSDRSLPGFTKALQGAYKEWNFPREKPVKGEAPKPVESQWPSFLEKVCSVLMDQMDSKGTWTTLSRREGSDVEQPMCFRGMFPANTISGIIAHGGTGKSLLGLILCLAVATGRKIGPFEPLIRGPVMYLDWENGADVHERRLTRVCDALGFQVPDNMHHYAARGKLTHAESELTERAYEYGAVFSALDSIGFAAGGNLNDSEVSTQAINVLKHIPGSKLMMAHVNKIDAAAPGEAKTPIGSTFFWNGPQAVYELRATVQDGGDEAAEQWVYAISQNKANLGRRLRHPVGLHITFNDPAGPILPVECEVQAATEGETGRPDAVSWAARIKRVLWRHPDGMTNGDLLKEMAVAGPDLETVRRTLSRLRERSEIVSLPPMVGAPANDREYKWALPGADPDFKCAKCGGAADRYNEKTGLPACERHQ